jgi:hypothetical protein
MLSQKKPSAGQKSLKIGPDQTMFKPKKKPIDGKKSCIQIVSGPNYSEPKKPSAGQKSLKTCPVQITK